MITNKVLIFAPYEININMGGYSGFIAHNIINKHGDNFILSTEISKFHTKNLITKLTRSIGKKIYKFLNKPSKDFATHHYFRKVNASNYKILYFHEVFSLYQCKDLISKDQIIILQSHAPELPSSEFLNMQSEHSKDILEHYNLIKKAEEYAFSRADIVVFPTPGCVPIYKDILKENSQIEFILSGAQSYENEIDDLNITSSVIEDDKINLLYIGRRNNVKGFDIVLDSFRKARKLRKDINLIVIGNGKKIQEDGVIDIGFSPNPIKWYKAVDYLVNANRSSYFDLSIIEALSTGVPIIMSHNQGHSFYKNISPLISTFDINEVNALYNLLIGQLKKRDHKDNTNSNIYTQYLTDQCYLERFDKFCLDIINSQNSK